MAIIVTDIDLVSTTALGTQGNYYSHHPIFSPDGTKIAFYSISSNFVAGDTNGVMDVFVKDLTTGNITRLSTDSLGTQGNDSSYDPAFSPDGTKIAFWGDASNLVTGDTNVRPDVFVKDLVTGAVTRFSVDSAGGQVNSGNFNPIFSPDGTKIAFSSHASNLVADDTNGTSDIFIKDLLTGAVTRVSTDSSGVQGNENSETPIFSPDGTKIAFVSRASNLVTGDTNVTEDIFVKNLLTGEITRVSTDSAGGQGNERSYANFYFSPDGTKIAFFSSATNLVAGDTNGVPDVFIKDLVTGSVTRVSTDALGVQGDRESESPTFSPDGTKIVFTSDSTNLVAGDTNGARDIFIKDLTTGEIVRVGGNGNANGFSPSFSPDGSKITFASSATNLVAGDTNGEIGDIFVATLNLPAGIYGSGLADVLNGTDTDNIIYGWQGDDTINGLLGNDFLRGGANQDTIHGDGGDDKVRGDDGVDTLYGDAGNDDVRGGNGDDIQYGGDGVDRLEGDLGNDTLNGDAGNDALRGEEGNDTLNGGTGDDDARGGAGNDVIHGNDGMDICYGDTGNDTVYGDAGDDRVYGNSGMDLLYGGTGNDRIDAGSGDDTVYGEDGNDSLLLGSGNDVANGGAGTDYLSGYNGNDTLNGGAGIDKLYGGADADTFVFDADALTGRDTVKDFTIAQGDKIELHDLLVGFDPLTSAITDFVRITDNGVNSYVSVDANGTAGGTAWTQIARLDGVVVGMTDEAQLLADHVLVVTNTGVV